MIQVAHTWAKITLSVWKILHFHTHHVGIVLTVYYHYCAEMRPSIFCEIQKLKIIPSVRYNRSVATSPSLPTYVHNMFRILTQLFFLKNPLWKLHMLVTVPLQSQADLFVQHLAWPLDIHIGNLNLIITIPVPWSFRLVRWQQHSCHSVLYGDSCFTCMLILLNYYYKKMR
jgi:hypothetical protein